MASPCYIRPIVLLGYGEIGVNPKGSPVEVYIANFRWGKYVSARALTWCISSWNRLAPTPCPPWPRPRQLYEFSANRMEAEDQRLCRGIGWT